MKLTELDQLKKMDMGKLNEELITMKKEHFKINFEVKTGQSKSIHLVKKYKTQVARIKTLLKSNITK